MEPNAPLSKRSKQVVELVRATGHDPCVMTYDDFLQWIVEWEGKEIAGKWICRDGTVVTIDLDSLHPGPSIALCRMPACRPDRSPRPRGTNGCHRLCCCRSISLW
jgi:hypothetical protein